MLGVAVVFALQGGMVASHAAVCEASGAIQFICGQSGPEDLVPVPAPPWVVASSYTAGHGGIRIISTRDFTTTILLPAASFRERFDKTTYGACPGPIAEVENEKFRTHGLSLRQGSKKIHTLFAVHHGSRESVEV